MNDPAPLAKHPTPLANDPPPLAAELGHPSAIGRSSRAALVVRYVDHLEPGELAEDDHWNQWTQTGPPLVVEP